MIKESKLKYKLQKKTQTLLLIMTIVLSIALGVAGTMFFVNRKKPELSAVAISQQLVSMSDLTTSKLAYRGLVRFEQGSIHLITKKSFNMVFDATVDAGIDLSLAKIDIKGKEITVKLPESKVLSAVIDPDSIEFYDEKNALFNWENKQDSILAMQMAKEDVLLKVENSDLLTAANEQAKKVIENLLTTFIKTGDDKMKIYYIYE